MKLAPPLTAGIALLVGALAIIWQVGGNPDLYVGFGISAVLYVGITVAVLTEARH